MSGRIQRVTAAVVLATIVGTANAELITRGDRERITAHIDREDVAAELASHGVTKEQATARVAALTDAEAASLAGRVDELPAGGFVFEMLLLLPVAVVYVAVIAVVGIAKGVEHLAKAIAKGPTAPAATPGS